MKKLFYILVAVFTMTSVNANAAKLRLHHCYPGGNDADVHEIIYMDVKNSDESIYEDASYSKRTIFIPPVYRGYKFNGYYYNYDGLGTIYKVRYLDERGVIFDDILHNEHGDVFDLYAHWGKNFVYAWESDGSGFYDNGTFYPWNHMSPDDIMPSIMTDINEVEVSNEVKSNPKTEGIYTLNGVKVNEITKSGIYIVNGKKVVR